jgi:predicted DCC family thiol-disulfide oxidoreductase YuxK
VLISDERGLLLFDGDCGICSWLARRAAIIDRKRRFRIEPYQAFDESALLAHGLTYEACGRAVQLITPRGRVRSGAFAVNGFLVAYMPYRVLVPWLYVLFPLLADEVVGYVVVARNRHRISRWLGLNACKIGGGETVR